jgi:cytochrome o ubiquinol oxidase subunit I
MAVVLIVILAVLALVTVKGWWPYLWREWLTSVDHKRIGVMYVVLGLVMLLRGYSDAIMMRTQQAIAVGDAQGYLPPDHYDQIFSAHGTIMIFFVAMPLVIGLMNFAVPLQLGVRDVAFPVLNSVSFWLTATGALLINMSLVIGNFARTGWMGYPPLSELAFSPDVGVDYYLWSNKPLAPVVRDHNGQALACRGRSAPHSEVAEQRNCPGDRSGFWASGPRTTSGNG